MYDEKPTRAEPLSVLPDPPIVCQSLGCHNDTNILFLQVRRGDDKLLTGAASDFCLDRDKPKDRSILKSDYAFHCWISRCGECYTRELRGANKHQMSGYESQKKKEAA